MKRLFASATRVWALALGTWLTLSANSGAQQAPNNDGPANVYGRVSPVGAAAAPATAITIPQSPPAVRLPNAEPGRTLFGPPLVAPPLNPQLPVVAPMSAAAPLANPLAGASSLWIVSTRRLPYAGGNPLAPDFAPDVQYYLPASGWVPSTFAKMLEATPGAGVTMVFVHGNDTDADFAARGGAALYAQLVSDPVSRSPATRFVVWSWPNQGTTLRVRKTTQASAARLGIEGYFLASCLRWLAPQGSTSLVGYSSGTAVVTGGLHVLGGGTLEGRHLASPAPPEASKIHAVLLGAAAPNDVLLPGMAHERAWTQVERLVITINPNDGVLQWYPFLWGRGGPTALGSTGIVDVARLGTAREKLVQLDLRNALNRNHGWKYYSSSPQVAQILRQEAITLPAERGQAMALARQPR